MTLADSPVYFSPVANLDNHYRVLCIVHSVDDTVLAPPKPILLLCRKFLTSERSRILREPLNPLHYVLAMSLGKSFELLYR